MAGPDPEATARLAAAQRAHAAGDVAGALDLLPAVVAARPDDLEARLLLARCLAETAEPVVALAAAEAAVDVDRTSWPAQLLVAQAARTVDPAKARRAADAANHLAPDEPEVIAVRAALADDEAGTGRTGKRPARARRSHTEGPAAPVGPAPAGGALPGTGEVDEMAARVLARARAAEERGAASPTRAVAPTPAPTARPVPTPTAAPAATPFPAVAPAPADIARPAGSTAETPTAKPLARQPLVIAGMACWLLVAFRYGVQVVGGPIGIAGFLVVVAALALYLRSRLGQQ